MVVETGLGRYAEVLHLIVHIIMLCIYQKFPCSTFINIHIAWCHYWPTEVKATAYAVAVFAICI